MSRLPPHYLDQFLEPHNDELRFSAVPAELARSLDAAAPAGEPHELEGWVVQLTNPRELVDQVELMAVSIVPAVLDEIVQRIEGVEAAHFLSPFALMVQGVERDALAPAMARFRRLLALALADYFDLVAELQTGKPEPAAQSVADDVVSHCSPVLRLHRVRFVFPPAEVARGQRLLDYLFDERGDSLEPEEWPRVITLG